MNYFKISLALLSILTFTVSSCKKDDGNDPQEVLTCEKPTNQVQEATTFLLGEWEWIETRYTDRAGEIVETPQNTNTTQSLKFDFNGTVEEKIGSQTTLYTFRVANTPDTQLGLLNLVFLNNNGDAVSQFAMNVCATELEIKKLGTSLLRTLKYKKKNE